MSTLETAFYRIIDDFSNRDEIKTPRQLLRKICSTYNLKTAAYFGVNVSKNYPNEPYLAVTYSSDWVEHYKSKNYVEIDPVIKSGFTSLLPIEWNSFEVRGSRLKTFFGEAAEFGIGNNGLTFPIRGRSGERALFTITSDVPIKEWQDSLILLKRDFQMIAYHLHQMIINIEGIEKPVVKLSPREIECLKWTASGKTNWETARIMGISEKTVRFYINLARVKLDATNATHAVAKALNQNLFLVSQ
jgi:DNA-binding CsgD family transcriptional regulator